MNPVNVKSAIYLQGYKVKIEFSDNTSKIVDFEPFLKEHHHPQWDKYHKITNFKKFRIENGNLVWGRNWDLIFPVYCLYTGDVFNNLC